MLAFFGQARLNRKISFSSAAQARAQVLAASALDFVKADLLEEIKAGSTVNGSAGAFEPAVPENMLPFRMVRDADLSGSGTVPFNLIKWSANDRPLWEGDEFTASGGAPAVNVSAATPAANGRYIDHARWERAFIGNSDTLATSIDPHWVLFTRRGPLAAERAEALLSSGTLADSVAGNADFVIGRYAYIVYDTGGLPDINAIGHASDVADDEVARKGNVGYADLTRLGLGAADVDELVKEYRNRQSAASGTTYVEYLSGTGAASASGFRRVADGDSVFVSRQDFLDAAQRLGFEDFYPYFTTFSREKNAPSWGPAHDAEFWSGINNPGMLTPIDPDTGTRPTYDYYAKRDDPASNNRFIPNVTVSVSGTRLSGERMEVGESLVKYRFDLAKIDWLRFNGVRPSYFPADADFEKNIYDNFGLRRIPDGTVNPSNGVCIGGAWEYDHGGRTSDERVRICTLAEVAAAGREPDFFELLQAVILRGSLGLTTGYPESNLALNRGEFRRMQDMQVFTDNRGNRGSIISAPIGRFEAISDDIYALIYAQEKHQILQIGANIIDQWDEDNFPTEIRMGGKSFYGVENLPYILSIGQSVVSFAEGAVDNTIWPNDWHAYLHSWLNFGLWNPHQNAADLLNSGIALRPPSVRILATNGSICPQIHDFSKYQDVASEEGHYYQRRTFLGLNRALVPSTAPSPTSNTTPSGPAWVAFKLADYNNCAEPTDLINSGIDKAYTSDSKNPGSANLNDRFGIVRSQYGWKRAAIYTGWSYAPENPFKIPQTEPLFPMYNDPPTITVTGGGGQPEEVDSDGKRFYWWRETNRDARQWTHIPPSNYRYPPLGGGAVVYSRFWPLLRETATGEFEASGGPIRIHLQYEDPASPGTWHTYQTLNSITNDIEGRGNPFMEENDPTWNNTNYDAIVPEYYEYIVNNAWQQIGPGQNMPARRLITNNASNLVPNIFRRANNKEAVALYFSDPRSQRTNLQLSDSPSGIPNGFQNNQSVLAFNFNPSEQVNLDRQFTWGPHFYRDGERPTESPNGPIDSNGNATFMRVTKSMANWASNEQANGTYYTDRDFVLRHADAVGGQGYAPQASSAASRRPIMLNRRFRSMAELGYVFRDDPWKTLNLFSANSADTGLLDVFYIGSGVPRADGGTPAVAAVAGKINLNSAARDYNNGGALVLESIISGAANDYAKFSSGTATVSDNDTLTASDMSKIARIINERAGALPLSSLGDLPVVMSGNNGVIDRANFSVDSKGRHEAVLRALTGSVQVRTWNLLIDLVAQVGRYGSGVNDLRNFIVEGEKHYWLHIAIDRFTGEIVDQQLEPVVE